jgi:hypothetical protein
MKPLALLSVIVALAAAASASAYSTTAPAAPPPAADMSLTEFVPKRWDRWHRYADFRHKDCRAAHHFGRDSREIAPWRRQENLDTWHRRGDRARARQPGCSPRELGKRIAAAWGWTGAWTAIDYVIGKESGWDPCRRFPSTTQCSYTGPRACGIPQFVPCSKLLDPCGVSTIGACPVRRQIKLAYRYMDTRYGGPWGAYAHWLAYRWY